MIMVINQASLVKRDNFEIYIKDGFSIFRGKDKTKNSHDTVTCHGQKIAYMQVSVNVPL